MREKWEIVADDTDRLPAPGGWLYRVRDRDGVALAYVPDQAADRERNQRRFATKLEEARRGEST